MDTPSLQMRVWELADCIGLERLTYIAKGKQKDIFHLWEPYLNIMEEKQET